MLLAMVVTACTATVAFATPQTQWEQGQWQIDAGAWNPKMAFDASHWMAGLSSYSNGTKWNFQGGVQYGLTDKWALQYQYYGLKTKEKGIVDNTTNGDAHEVNLVYSINKNFAAYAGWNRINNDIGDPDGTWSDTNNIAQIGIIAKARLAKGLDIYGKAAVGTKRTALWEAGLGYSITPDLDISAGYRYVNTKWADKGDVVGMPLRDDANITYKGFIAGLSYRFGGGHEKETPAPEPVYQPRQPEYKPEAPQPKKDYYVDSIHFGFDEDQPLPSEQAKLDHFVQVAKEHPQDGFKLIGNTDNKGTDGYNDDLSKRRVTNVATYAVNQGVSSEQLMLGYEGESDPVSTNDTDQGRADNRRVDIWHHR